MRRLRATAGLRGLVRETELRAGHLVLPMFVAEGSPAESGREPIASMPGVERLSLAVDANNAPALRLYYRHGLQRVGSKIAMMRDLRLTGAEV